MSFKLDCFGACCLLCQFVINAAFLTGGITLLEPLFEAEEGTGQEGAQKPDQ